jgi:hypothetical protein
MLPRVLYLTDEEFRHEVAARTDAPAKLLLRPSGGQN